MSSRRAAGGVVPAAPPSPTTPARRRTGIFHRESTRLRSNVADQVQRDLLPAGRMLSVFLILCELLAECAVLIWSRGQPCDRPLRFWVQVLIVLQAGTVILNCLNIWQGRDTFGQHRNGLSATEIDMYTDAPATPAPPSHQSVSTSVRAAADPVGADDESVVVEISHTDAAMTRPVDADADAYHSMVTEHLLYSRDEHSPTSPRSRNASSSLPATPGSSSPHYVPSSSATVQPSDPLPPPVALVSTEFVDRYVRIVNAWYLVWFILGSIWVSDGGTCSTTAPHLYRLIVALTIIYYALLFLPLACFCLIVCCLPLFILVYRIMLPYAERERRRARAADPAQVENLNSIVYSPDTFTSHTGNPSLEDASCVICLCDYEEDEVVRFLPCKHHFHKDCVDVWLRLDKACCLCKQDIDAQSTTPPHSSAV